MIDILFILSVLFIMILIFNRSNKSNAILLLIHSAYILFIALIAIIQNLNPSLIDIISLNAMIPLKASYSLSQYFNIDSVNIIFLLVTAILYVGISLYNYYFIAYSEEKVERNNNYSIGIITFLFSMIGLILSTHLTLLWVFIELSTLSSTFLIIYKKSRNSLEAGWKYVYICSIGIALAFFGIILLTIGLGEHNSLFFNDLYMNAKNINPFWLKLSFIFILIGMGTKMGLAPVHTWLPDAHSEAPSPVSALLSGGLLNIAFLGIVRFNKLMKLADFNNLSSSLLMLMGFFSLIICAIYVFRVKNYKRMFAYSSIENMGIIAIGLSLGGFAMYAALFHMIAHSLSKGSMFLTAGNILHQTKSKSIFDIQGLLKSDKINAYLFLFSFLSLSGIPPFPIFISELYLIKALFLSHTALSILFVILLTIIIAGMGKNVFSMIFGNPTSEISFKKMPMMAYAPQFIFLVILIIMGIYLPKPLHQLLINASLSM